MNLYEFLMELYEMNYEDEYLFSEFVKEFMENTIGTHSTHEAFGINDDFIGEYTVRYELDEINKEIRLNYNLQ